jgi:CMP/dCMP kinase
MSVITISRQFGSHGDEIAARVGDILHYQKFDKSIITQAAAEAGLHSEDITDYSEENYRVRSFLNRIFGRPTALGQARMWKENASGERSLEEIALTEGAVVSLVEKAIRTAFRKGNMVIIGRGSQVILKHQSGVIHVRIVAPLEDRIQFVKKWLIDTKELSSTNRNARQTAQELIMERDAASADYIQRFYHVDWNDPLLYSLVLNTGRISIHQAIQAITNLTCMVK